MNVYMFVEVKKLMLDRSFCRYNHAVTYGIFVFKKDFKLLLLCNHGHSFLSVKSLIYS